MRLKKIVLISAVLLAAGIAAPDAFAQRHEHEKAGPPPECPYGYFDFSPYDCAPYGYYGSEWFHEGAFMGASPWFRGPEDFHGQVDDHFNPHYGYKGNLPQRGEQRDNQHPVDHVRNFRSTEERDGKGNQYREQTH